MKNCFPSTICILLHLGLLNFVLQVVSKCSISGPYVYQTGDQLNLKCVDDAAGHQTNWLLNDSQKNDHRTKILPEGSNSILTIANLTLNDSRTHRCQCASDSCDHSVLVVEASMYASLNNASCEVAIISAMTVQQKDKEHFFLKSFSCPTLGDGSPSIWEFSGVTNDRGDFVIHRLALGKSGVHTNHTCNFTVEYRPNGATFNGSFSKTVTVGETSCSEPGSIQSAGHGANDSVSWNQGSVTSRATQCSLLLTALILLANH